MKEFPTLEPGLDSKDVRRLKEVAHEVGAFLTGDFTLTSGKKSNYYIDGKRITLSPEGAYLCGRIIFNELAGSEVSAVGGVATGAYPMVTAVGVVSHLEGRPLPIFVVREVAKGHGAKRKIEGSLKENVGVAILEDVLTTGGSVLRAIEAVEDTGSRVLKVITLVDRCEGGGDSLREAGYDLTAILKVAH